MITCDPPADSLNTDRHAHTVFSEMARAETIESVGETAGGASGPLPRHSNTCGMELPRPFHTWPGLLTAGPLTAAAGPGAVHLHHNHHHLRPLQAVYLSYPPSHPRPGSQDRPRARRHSPAPSPPPPSSSSSSPPPPPSPVCSRKEERGGGVSGERSDSEGEELQEACSRRGPLPDLLPQNEHPSWASPRRRAPRQEAVRELEVRRVANQLRAIGDEFDATVRRRAHVAPPWQDWRDACRGVLNFITQTLSTLYRLT